MESSGEALEESFSGISEHIDYQQSKLNFLKRSLKIVLDFPGEILVRTFRRNFSVMLGGEGITGEILEENAGQIQEKDP